MTRIQKIFIAILLATVILPGCTQLKTIPATAHYEQTDQHLIQASKHWELVADHVSKQIMVSLGNSGLAPSRPVIYIAPAENSVFGKAFHGFLLSHLVAQGMQITTNDTDYTITIDYETQVVHHGTRGIQLLPGTLTALGLGAWAVRGLIDASTTVAVAGTAAGVIAADTALLKYDHSLKPQPNTEIILDVYAIAGEQYIAHNSNIYYINDPDKDHYIESTSTEVSGYSLKQFKVVSE